MNQIFFTIKTEKQKHAEYMRQYFKDNPDKYHQQLERAKLYRKTEKYKSKRKYYDQKYLKLHIESRKLTIKKYEESHREQKLEYGRKYVRRTYPLKREKLLEDKRQWRIKNPELALHHDKKYRLKYPHKILKNALRQMNRNADKMNMLKHVYRQAQIAWSNAIKKNDNHQCVICGNRAEFSHHILYRSNYPQLQFNLNNGVSLCKKHHIEVHKFDTRWNQK